MKPVIVHPAARRELEEAIAWYEGRSPGLGLDFATEIQSAFRKLQRHSEMGPRYKHTGYRKILVDRFPYLIFFLELPDEIWVVAIAHGSRFPGYWKGRKPEK